MHAERRQAGDGRPLGQQSIDNRHPNNVAPGPARSSRRPSLNEAARTGPGGLNTYADLNRVACLYNGPSSGAQGWGQTNSVVQKVTRTKSQVKPQRPASPGTVVMRLKPRASQKHTKKLTANRHHTPKTSRRPAAGPRRGPAPTEASPHRVAQQAKPTRGRRDRRDGPLAEAARAHPIGQNMEAGTKRLACRITAQV